MGLKKRRNVRNYAEKEKVGKKNEWNSWRYDNGKKYVIEKLKNIEKIKKNNSVQGYTKR